MSNYLAIATVTAALAQLLQNQINDDVPGAIVTNVRPDSNGSGTPATGVNLYLYQVTPNTHWRNHDVPTRDKNGNLLQRPRIALDLHYLLTFYGDETLWEPQRILGSAVRTLHARPVVDKTIIQDAMTANPILAESDLSEETELVKLTPIPLTLEELSKLWSVFFQIPYTLSLAYQGTVVFIEQEIASRATLPVLQRNIYVRPFRQPEITEVLNQDGAQVPLVAGSTLLIRGRRLQGDDTHLRVAGEEVTPPSIGDSEIALILDEPPFTPDMLRAGIQGVQVVHNYLIGTPPAPHKGVESNIMPFVVHPTINNVSAVSGPDGVKISVKPKIGKKQRVLLLLNEKAAVDAAAYSFKAPPRNADVGEITILTPDVKAGTYLVRLQVDGAESLLTLGGGPNNPQLQGPKVVIP